MKTITIIASALLLAACNATAPKTCSQPGIDLNCERGGNERPAAERSAPSKPSEPKGPTEKPGGPGKPGGDKPGKPSGPKGDKPGHGHGDKNHNHTGPKGGKK
jgi:hypothetical protein